MRCITTRPGTLTFQGFPRFRSGFLTVSTAGLLWATAVAPGRAVNVQEGNQVVINGQPVPGAWALWPDLQSAQPSVGIADSVWMRYLGGDLGDTTSLTQQPVQWFSSAPTTLSTRLNRNGTARYLNLTDAARQWGWQLTPRLGVLDIRTPSATVQSVQVGQQPWGRRLVLTLDRPTPWRLASLTNSRTGKTDRQFTIQTDATLSPTALQGFSMVPGLGLKSLKITPASGRIALQGTMDGRFQPQIWTLDNPPRLVVDIRQTPMKSRRIVWAPGLVWREDLVSLGNAQFPVTWLAVNLRQPGLRLLPLWGGSNALVGIDGLSTMAQRNQAAAAINAGFFSRDRQTTLGAIRREGVWVSSPILNRGVIAWTPQGQVKVGRLMLQEWVATQQGQTLMIASSNSGYPQKGMARYTDIWGPTYTPLLKNEQVATVINNQVQSLQPAPEGTAIPIPRNGYLLVLRGIPPGPELAPGNQLQYQGRSIIPAFEAYPNIMGAGPLLIENGRIVVDAIAEQFNPTFAQQSADRSGIGQTADGTVLLAATHNRIGGPGPTLGEWAQIMRQLGA
ncbi:MAG: phosphodiester glycosidase family protein, partial [Thermosynechococcaceae cyanobacterium]